jgi:hypothetical protein
MEVVLPYVASEIKQQVSRLVDLNATYVFTYFELKSPAPIDVTEEKTEINS